VSESLQGLDATGGELDQHNWSTAAPKTGTCPFAAFHNLPHCEKVW